AAQAQGMADALADWIDSDDQRAPLGAEDRSYAARADGYRTGATLLAEPSELRAIRGYDAVAYARLRPHVCALPVGGPSPVNVNALVPAQAPVRSEEHTSELQSRENLVCRLLLEKKNRST